MDVVQQEHFNVPKAITVSGLTQTERDDEDETHLKAYGSISRFIHVDDPQSKFHKQIIVEFSPGTAMQALEGCLLYDFKSPSSPDIIYNIKALACTRLISSRATQSFIGELQEIAKLTGKTFEEILYTELTNLSVSCGSPASDDHVQYDSDLQDSELRIPQQMLASPNIPTTLKSKMEVKTSPKLTMSDKTPVEVQKVVVEHIVRSEEVASTSLMSFRLRVRRENSTAK